VLPPMRSRIHPAPLPRMRLVSYRRGSRSIRPAVHQTTSGCGLPRLQGHVSTPQLRRRIAQCTVPDVGRIELPLRGGPKAVVLPEAARQVGVTNAAVG